MIARRKLLLARTALWLECRLADLKIECAVKVAWLGRQMKIQSRFLPLHISF